MSKHKPGQGCQCGARHEGDCACLDVDWTPSRVKELEDELARAKTLAEENGKLAHKTACDLAKLKNTIRQWRDASDSEMRLRLGEVTAQEIRSIRAVLNHCMYSGS